jgi:hypothetical protein
LTIRIKLLERRLVVITIIFFEEKERVRYAEKSVPLIL